MKMKYAILIMSLFAVSSAYAQTQPQATFQRDYILNWSSGASDVVLGGVKSKCTPEEEAAAKQGAETAALEDCNADTRMLRCFVSSKRITWNGPLTPALMQKYGIERNRYTLNTPHGCEAQATVFGF